MKDDDGDLTTTINGIQILISDENLQTLCGLPQDGEDLSRYFQDGVWDEQPPLNQIGLGHFDPRVTSRRPTITGMLPEYRLIFYFITRVLKPCKHSHTTISQEDAKILHAIITGARINW